MNELVHYKLKRFQGKFCPCVSSEHRGHFLDRDQLPLLCSPTAAVHRSWQRRPRSHRKRSSEVTLELQDGSLPHGPPAWKDPGFTEVGRTQPEVRWSAGRPELGQYVNNTATWETWRRRRPNWNTSVVRPGWRLRGRAASPESGVVAVSSAVGGMNERKEQRVRGRRREDEQVPCWLAFAIILLLQSKPERQDGPVGGEDGRPIRSQTDLRPVKSQKHIPQVCFVLQTLGYQGYNSNHIMKIIRHYKYMYFILLWHPNGGALCFPARKIGTILLGPLRKM